MTKNVNNNDKLNFVIYYNIYLKLVNFNENKCDFFNVVKKIRYTRLLLIISTIFICLTNVNILK